MKKILIVCLLVALLVSSVVGTVAFAEADTRALKQVTVNVILNEGVKKICVSPGSTYDADLFLLFTIKMEIKNEC